MPVSHEALDGDVTVMLDVEASEDVRAESFTLLADHLVATRRVRAEELASDLENPALDSTVRLLSPGDRAWLLDRLAQALLHHDDAHQETILVDPIKLRNGDITLGPIGDLCGQSRHKHRGDLADFTQPGLGLGAVPVGAPDDQSYRDYLRSVFVLFAHQQKLGRGREPGRPSRTSSNGSSSARFFQDFRTTDRTEVPLNRMLVPLVTAILTASTGSGFGFGLTAAALPAQGQLTDRQHLDALLALAPVTVEELANRYRLPLGESDTVLSTPVKLNVHTLSRVLSDTAQGPVEPPENVIEPQLPGEEGDRSCGARWSAPLPSSCVSTSGWPGSSPSSPRTCSHCAPRSSASRGVDPGSTTTARSSWSTTRGARHAAHGVVQRATSPRWARCTARPRFLLKYGEADTKLVELVQAIDRGQFADRCTAPRRGGAAAQRCHTRPQAHENWEPEVSAAPPRGR